MTDDLDAVRSRKYDSLMGHGHGLEGDGLEGKGLEGKAPYRNGVLLVI
jgi:hypothetical protein